MRPFDIYNLTECIVCKSNFNDIRKNIEPTRNSFDGVMNETKTEIILHMIKHFDQEIRHHIRTNKNGPSFICLLVRKPERLLTNLL